MPNTTSARLEEKPEPTTCKTCGRLVEPMYFRHSGNWYSPDTCGDCDRRRTMEEADRAERHRRAELVSQANLPPEAAGWTFEAAEKRARETLGGEDLAAWLRAATACRTWPPTSRKGLYLQGPTGRGKTVLSYCMLHGVMVDFGRSGLFVGMREMFEDTVRTWRHDQAAKDFLTRAREVGVLVLDELDPAGLKDWMKRVVFSLLDKRIKEQRPTIITTNCSLDEMDRLLGDPHERVMSRIMGNFNGVRVGGADFRCVGAKNWWVA